nr:hypothetical protein [Tanacetum cinerariifolium]
MMSMKKWHQIVKRQRNYSGPAYVSKMDAKENTARDPARIWKLHDRQLLKVGRGNGVTFKEGVARDVVYRKKYATVRKKSAYASNK